MDSSTSSTKTIICCILVQFIHIVSALTLPRGVKVPAIFGFGDSIIDPGNNNYIPTLVKCNFPPYGKEFMGGVPSGRFSNGRIPTDLIAQLLGIKDIVPPYLDPSLKPHDLLTGVSFASGGAGYDPLTAEIVGVLGMKQQLDLFKEYTGKIQEIAGKERVAEILAESLYLIVAGSDDIANTYFTVRVRSNYDFPSYAHLMVQGASYLIQELYRMGARRIGVFSAPPIGCVPSQRTLGGGLARTCSESSDKLAQIFNSKLSSEVARLNSQFTHGRAVYIDVYSPLYDLINNPHNYGFEVATEGCCGTGKLETVVLCNDLNPFTCEDDSKYVFWDSYHPTERAYLALVGPLLNKYLNSFF